MPLVGTGVRVEHDDAAIAGVGDEDFVSRHVDGHRGRLVQRRRAVGAAISPGLPICSRNLPSRVELEHVRIFGRRGRRRCRGAAGGTATAGTTAATATSAATSTVPGRWARSGNPDVALASTAMPPGVAASVAVSGSAPASDERAGAIEREHRRRRSAAGLRPGGVALSPASVRRFSESTPRWTTQMRSAASTATPVTDPRIQPLGSGLGHSRSTCRPAATGRSAGPPQTEGRRSAATPAVSHVGRSALPVCPSSTLTFHGRSRPRPLCRISARHTPVANAPVYYAAFPSDFRESDSSPASRVRAGAGLRRHRHPSAHDIVSDVIVQAFVKPEGERLRVLSGSRSPRCGT